MLTIGAVVLALLYFVKNRGAGGGNGGTGETVYLRASDAYGLVGTHKIEGSGVTADVGYDPDVYALKAGAVYNYTSTGNYAANLSTTWSYWPEKPANTRVVTLQILSGSTSGTAQGVGFTFKLV